MHEVWPGAIELFARAEQEADLRVVRRQQAEAEARAASDIRVVEGDVANMRGGPGTDFEKITALTGGTEVMVLGTSGNGWLQLQVIETGEVGWMADWLVSAGFDATGLYDAGVDGSGVN